MRAYLLLLGVCAVVLLGACDQTARGSDARTAPSPSPMLTARLPPPAADAGGICALLDYGLIKDALGIDFDVAAAGRQGKSYTCVVRSSQAHLPDLLLTMNPTTADASVFRADMAPTGARKVTALGKAAYRGTLKAGKGRGPAAEVGWLTDDKRIFTLRLTTPAGTPRTAAEWHSVRLVPLAKKVHAALP